MKDQLILVTGASGFVGRAIARRLLGMGARVRVLVRSKAKLREAGFSPENELGLEVIEGDLLDGPVVRRCCEGVSAIVHAAAKVGDGGPPDEYLQINVDAQRDLLASISWPGPFQKFVLVSSLGVYPARNHNGTDESAPISTTGIDPYTRSKAIGEREFVRWCEERKFPGVVLRPGFVYGPGDRTVLPRIVARLRSGHFAFFGSGNQCLNNTWVENLVDAVILALEKDTVPGDVFNITDDPLVTKKQFIGAVAKALGLPLPRKHLPLQLAWLLAVGFDTVDRLMGGHGPKVVTMASWKFLGLDLRYSIAKAKQKLGYNPKSNFDEVMALTMRDWLKEESGVGSKG